MESRIDYLSKLPEDLLRVKLRMQLFGAYPPFHLSSFIFFTKVSKYYNTLFAHHCNLALQMLRLLLRRGALGELSNAESIWRDFPDLLTYPGTIYFPNRCYIDAEGKPLSQPIDIPLYQNPGRDGYDDLTFWQILWVNEEYEEAKEAGKLISDDEKQKQLLEIFPDGKIIKYNFDLDKAKELLLALFKEVIKDKEIAWFTLDKMNQSTRNALYRLYDYAKPNTKHKKGLISDPNFYIEALKFFDDGDTFVQFQNWNQRAFWCVRVEEWLAGRLGTRFLRPHAQGINNPLSRAGCILADGSEYFAFRRSPHYNPGSGFFVGYKKPYPQNANLSSPSLVWLGSSGVRLQEIGYTQQYSSYFRTLCQETRMLGEELMAHNMQQQEPKETDSCQII